MNPKYKITKNGTHNKDARNLLGQFYMTFAKAADAKKWNQGHFVTKFALTLIEFTPAYMHPFIVRGISIFLKKKMLIDPLLMAAVINNSKMTTDNDFLQKFHDHYWGSMDERPVWMPEEPGQFIQTETGMMQGMEKNTKRKHTSKTMDWCVGFNIAHSSAKNRIN